MSINQYIADALARDVWIRTPAPDLTSKAKPGAEVTVTYPVSISYNGGTVVDGKWYGGYLVPDPIVPAGYELVDMGVGLQLNARPPTCTMKLRPIRRGEK